MTRCKSKALTQILRAEFWQRQKLKSMSPDPMSMYFPGWLLCPSYLSIMFCYLSHLSKLAFEKEKHFLLVLYETRYFYFRTPEALQPREQTLVWTSQRNQRLSYVPSQSPCTLKNILSQVTLRHCPVTRNNYELCWGLEYACYHGMVIWMESLCDSSGKTQTSLS
jgi:hypothetical protein